MHRERCKNSGNEKCKIICIEDRWEPKIQGMRPGQTRPLGFLETTLVKVYGVEVPPVPPPFLELLRVRPDLRSLLRV